MTVTKTGNFSVASPPGTVNTTTVRNAIVNTYAAIGVSPFASGLKGANPTAVFAIQFSGAARGTVYQEFVCSISGSTITVTQTIYATYDAATFSGTGPSPATTFQVTTAQVERVFFAYVKADEFYCLATRNPGSVNAYLAVLSPTVKPEWWNEDLFCHAFIASFAGDSGSPSLWGIYRGLDPAFFNPFPNTISTSANNVTVSAVDHPAFGFSPATTYDVVVQLPLRWTGVTNYGWVGRFSIDFGFTADDSLQIEQRIQLTETEVYEVLSVGNDRAFLARVV